MTRETRFMVYVLDGPAPLLWGCPLVSAGHSRARSIQDGAEHVRSHILAYTSAGISAVAVAALFALPASATGRGIGVAHWSSVGPTGSSITNKTCKSQQDNDNGVGIVSQNFEPAFDIYDSQGADDFKCKQGAQGAAGYTLKVITADGTYFNGSGPADSYNVTYYAGGGTPGAIQKTCANASYTDTGFGSPTITCKVTLSKGAHWVSVQANMDFSTGGEWGWNTNNTVRGNASQWENPGDGFGTGCVTYTTTTTCIASGEGGDFSFGFSK